MQWVKIKAGFSRVCSSEQCQEQYQVQLFKISWGVYLYSTRLRCCIGLLFGTDVDWALWRCRRKYSCLPDLLGNLTYLKKVADYICSETSHSSLAFNLLSIHMLCTTLSINSRTLIYGTCRVLNVNSRKGLGFDTSQVLSLSLMHHVKCHCCLGMF